mgnify:CR=1 FL=1
MTAVAAIAALLVQIAAASPVDLPLCGSKDRDIGRGFLLTQYMFNGHPEFSLVYQPPAASVRTHGVSMTASFQLRFGQLDLRPFRTRPPDLSGPLLGYANYEFRKPDGTRLGLGAIRFDCGGGTILNARYSSEPPRGDLKVPISFPQPFHNQPVAACLSELQAHGRFGFRVGEHSADDPFVTIGGEIPFARALSEAERIWRNELARAERGECRIAPPPPPPF